MVKSISWPTALTTGICAWKMARATISSLNSHKSSMLPPPRAITIRSMESQVTLGVDNSLMAVAISAAAPIP
jgi:hypothetical protein